MSINALFKFSAIDALSEDSNTTDKTQTLLLKNKLRSKKRTKKEDKDKRKRDRTGTAKTILKTKRRKIFDKKIDRNRYNLIKQ